MALRTLYRVKEMKDTWPRSRYFAAMSIDEALAVAIHTAEPGVSIISCRRELGGCEIYVDTDRLEADLMELLALRKKVVELEAENVRLARVAAGYDKPQRQQVEEQGTDGRPPGM